MAREWAYATLDRPAIVRNLGPRSVFGRQLREKSAKQVTRILEQIGEDAVARAEAYIAETFERRPPDRRRDPGSRHLQGSIRFRLHLDATGFPTGLELFSNANPDKVFALEFGAPAHTITGNPLLAFPRQGGGLVVTPEVPHPGNKAYRFMGRALEAAVRERLGQSIRVA